MLKRLLEPNGKAVRANEKAVLHQYRVRKYCLLRYLPSSISKRHWMMELQRSGYNDIFLPNMEKLSPAYREYRNALSAINDRICSELNLGYDEYFHLMKKIIKLFLSVLEISAIHSRNREYQVGGTLLLCYVFRNVLRATACMLTYKQSCIKKQGILRALLFHVYAYWQS